MPRRTLTAFLFTLYLWTPFLNIIPTPSFLPSPSAPSQNYGNTSLPPGTVTDILPSPKLVQSQGFDYRIQTRTVSTPSGCAGTQGCLTWITPQGNLTFSKQYPFAMSYAYFGAKNNTAVSLAVFDVTESNHGLLRPGLSTVTTTATTYEVNTSELSSGPNTLQGYLDVKYDFASAPFKATATYTTAIASSFNIRWLVAGYDYVADPLTNATRRISSLPTDTNATLGLRPAVSLTDAPTGRGHHTLIDVHDSGNATFVYGHLRFFLGSGNATHYHAVAAVFPTNASRIDPTLVQMDANTCSYVCSGGTTTASLPSGVTANDMLVVTIVTDNSNILSVSDSLGTKIAKAVSASTSSCGNVLSLRYANNNYVYYGYSPAYANAYLTKTSLVANGQNITTYHTYDFDTGFMTSTTDPRGYTTSTTYDALGRVLTTTYPAVNGLSSVESVSYNDPFGPVTITDPRGNQTSEYFDGLGRMIAVQRMNGLSVYSTTYYTNNWLDRVAQVTDARGYTFSFAYDQAGRLTKESFPDGTAVTASYDDTHNVVTTKDQDGREAVSTYDWNGRLVSVQKFSTSTQSYLTSYAYDGVGNLVSVTNADGQTTSYSYDDLNRLARTTTPDGNAAAYAYDNVGNLVSKTTPNGATIGYTYDQANRLVGTNYPDGTFTDVSYDQDGNVVSVASTLSGSTTDAYSYDPLNRLSSATMSVSGAAYTTTHAYDKAGNLVEIQYPDGLVVPMTYDAMNRLKTVGSYASFAYNQDDGVTTITFGDGEAQSYSYDSRDRPTSIQDISGNKKLLSLAYAYDGASNVVSVNNDNFGYDGMNRVTSAKGPGGNVTYTYDGAGNMLSSGAKSGQTVYDNCGYYSNSLSGAVVQCRTDRDGNVVSKTGGWAYSYNFEDEMTVARVNGATIQTNVYDGIGNRVEKRETGTTVFTYLGVDVLFEKDLTTGATTDHIYGNGMQLAKVTGGTTYYYHEDHVGSNELVTYTDSRGRVSTQFSSGYTAYGSNYHPKGSESFQYTDRMLDSATGLYYFNARFYDPSTMRFMTKDPVAGDTAMPTSLNLYAYAGDDPLSNVDPTGTVFLAPAIDPWQWFFSLENQIRGLVGLPPCGAACQEIQIDRFSLIAPFIGMYTGGEGDVAEFLQRGVASLTTEQFDALVRGEPIGRYRTSFVQARLAVKLGGSMRVEWTETRLGYRIYDIKAPGLLGELKLGIDRLNPDEFEKDIALLKSGRNVHYYLVDNPVEDQKTPLASINKLKALGIPYTHFTWDEFLRWTEIPG